MGGRGKNRKIRWKISSLYHRRHRSPSSSTTENPTEATTPRAAEPPSEFVCPISGRLMAEPVIVHSGQTFERNCIQAYKDLGVAPPSILPTHNDAGGATAPPPPPPPPAAADFLLIPNMALKTAIHNWCDSLGLARPQPIEPDAALHFVSRLISSSPSSCSGSCSSSTSLKAKEADGEEEKPNSPLPLVCSTYPSPLHSSSPSSTSTSYTTSTSASTSTSSSEIIADESQSPPKPPTSSNISCPLEEEILARLRAPQISEQEAALIILRSATRDGGDERRASLCTKKLLSALRPMLISRYPSLQANAAASVVNLSLHPPNRVRIVRSGAVPALVDVLKAGHPEGREHAAGALFSLAIDDDNKVAIGVLGALLPLLHLLSRPVEDKRTRRDAAMALYHLSKAGTNRSKLVKLGAVRTLLGITTAAPGDSARTFAGSALMILCNLATCREGRAAMMDAGAVEALVGLLRESSGSAAAEDELRREYCMAALFDLSKGSMRFRGLARAAGAEELLREVAEEEAAAEEKGRRWRTREKARRTLRAVRGEDEEWRTMEEARRTREEARRTLEAMRGEDEEEYGEEGVEEVGDEAKSSRVSDPVAASGSNSGEF